MKDHAVVIAGAGPTGLMLAGELALAQVDVAIVVLAMKPASQGYHACRRCWSVTVVVKKKQGELVQPRRSDAV